MAGHQGDPGGKGGEGEVSDKALHVETVASLLAQATDDAIVAELDTYYGEGFCDDYREMLPSFRACKPLPTRFQCVLERLEDFDSGSDCINVFGKEMGNDTRWSLSCTDWREWHSMPVILEPGLTEMAPAQILAHVLYEVSWGGWTQEERSDKLDFLQDRMEEVKQAIEDGDTSGFVKIELPKMN
jgi:hypothetical protein